MPNVEFTPYHDYLASSHWQDISGKALERDCFACRLCGSPKNLHVHHVSYERIGRESLDDLVTLCRSCHSKLHKNESLIQEARSLIPRYKGLIPFVYLWWLDNNGRHNEAMQLNNYVADNLFCEFINEYGIEKEQAYGCKLFAVNEITARRHHAVIYGLKNNWSIGEIANYHNIPKKSVKKIVKRIGEIMPKIDMKEYEATQAKEGTEGFAQMKPGLYKLKIMAVRTEWDTKSGHTDGIEKQCVRLVYDVADGDFAGHYDNEFWEGEDRDFGHSVFFSWKNLGYFKHRMTVLEACNPGWDAMADFQADNWDGFVGKEFWCVMNGTVSTNDRGYDRWILDVGKWLTPDQVANGDYPEPEVEDKRTVVSADEPTDTYSDVPF